MRQGFKLLAILLLAASIACFLPTGKKFPSNIFVTEGETMLYQLDDYYRGHNLNYNFKTTSTDVNLKVIVGSQPVSFTPYNATNENTTIFFRDIDILSYNDAWSNISYGISADQLIYRGINYNYTQVLDLKKFINPPSADDLCNNITAFNTGFGYYVIVICHNDTKRTKYFFQVSIDWANQTNVNETMINYTASSDIANAGYYNSEALLSTNNESSYIIEYFKAAQNYQISLCEFVRNDSTFSFNSISEYYFTASDVFKDLSVVKGGIFILTVDNRILSINLEKKNLVLKGTFKIPGLKFNGDALKIKAAQTYERQGLTCYIATDKLYIYEISWNRLKTTGVLTGQWYAAKTNDYNITADVRSIQSSDSFIYVYANVQTYFNETYSQTKNRQLFIRRQNLNPNPSEVEVIVYPSDNDAAIYNFNPLCNFLISHDAKGVTISEIDSNILYVIGVKANPAALNVTANISFGNQSAVFYFNVMVLSPLDAKVYSTEALPTQVSLLQPGFFNLYFDNYFAGSIISASSTDNSDIFTNTHPMTIINDVPSGKGYEVFPLGFFPVNQSTVLGFWSVTFSNDSAVTTTVYTKICTINDGRTSNSTAASYTINCTDIANFNANSQNSEYAEVFYFENDYYYAFQNNIYRVKANSKQYIRYAFQNPCTSVYYVAYEQSSKKYLACAYANQLYFYDVYQILTAQPGSQLIPDSGFGGAFPNGFFQDMQPVPGKDYWFYGIQADQLCLFNVLNTNAGNLQCLALFNETIGYPANDVLFSLNFLNDRIVVRQSDTYIATYIYDIYSIDNRKQIGDLETQTVWNTSNFGLKNSLDKTHQRDTNFKMNILYDGNTFLTFIVDNSKFYKQRVRGIHSISANYPGLNLEYYRSIISELAVQDPNYNFEIGVVYPKNKDFGSLAGSFFYINKEPSIRIRTDKDQKLNGTDNNITVSRTQTLFAISPSPNVNISYNVTIYASDNYILPNNSTSNGFKNLVTPGDNGVMTTFTFDVKAAYPQHYDDAILKCDNQNCEFANIRQVGGQLFYPPSQQLIIANPVDLYSVNFNDDTLVQIALGKNRISFIVESIPSSQDLIVQGDTISCKRLSSSQSIIASDFVSVLAICQSETKLNTAYVFQIRITRETGLEVNLAASTIPVQNVMDVKFISNTEFFILESLSYTNSPFASRIVFVIIQGITNTFNVRPSPVVVDQYAMGLNQFNITSFIPYREVTATSNGTEIVYILCSDTQLGVFTIKYNTSRNCTTSKECSKFNDYLVNFADQFEFTKLTNGLRNPLLKMDVAYPAIPVVNSSENGGVVRVFFNIKGIHAYIYEFSNITSGDYTDVSYTLRAKFIRYQGQDCRRFAFSYRYATCVLSNGVLVYPNYIPGNSSWNLDGNMTVIKRVRASDLNDYSADSDSLSFITPRFSSSRKLRYLNGFECDAIVNFDYYNSISQKTSIGYICVNRNIQITLDSSSNATSVTLSTNKANDKQVKQWSIAKGTATPVSTPSNTLVIVLSIFCILLTLLVLTLFGYIILRKKQAQSNNDNSHNLLDDNNAKTLNA